MYRLDPSIVPRSNPSGFHLAHVSDIQGRKTGPGESEAYIELIDRNTLPWLTMRLSLNQAYNQGEIFFLCRKLVVLCRSAEWCNLRAEGNTIG